MWDVLPVRIGANFHVILVQVVQIWSKWCERSLGRVVRIWFVCSAAANNLALFSGAGVKMPYKCAAPPVFLWSFIVIVIFGVIFPSVVQFFALSMRFGANFLQDQCALPRPVTYFKVCHWSLSNCDHSLAYSIPSPPLEYSQLILFFINLVTAFWMDGLTRPESETLASSIHPLNIKIVLNRRLAETVYVI